MDSLHWTHEDSTKNKPHYSVIFTSKQGNYIGEYSIMGYYLYNVYISEPYRGKGFCKKIVGHAVKRKKNLFLDVDPDNKPAIRCYEGCGFGFKKRLYDYHHPSWGKNVPKAKMVSRYVHKKKKDPNI